MGRSNIVQRQLIKGVTGPDVVWSTATVKADHDQQCLSADQGGSPVLAYSEHPESA
jgi:hypothetical protein